MSNPVGWFEIYVQDMKRAKAFYEGVLGLKLQAHPSLMRQLVATGDAQLIEDCSSRPRGSGLFWGAALQDGAWMGKNQLGRLWMELRDAARGLIGAREA